MSKGLILLGGGEALCGLAGYFLSKGYKLLVITSPRHAKEKIDNTTCFEEVLTKQGVTVEIFDNLNKASSVIERFRQSVESFLAFSFGAAWIFKKQHIEGFFDNLLFNIHSTRLPTYRGGGGFTWQILNNSRFGLALIHKIDEGVDTGDIVAFKEFFYPATCRIPLDYMVLCQQQSMMLVKEFVDGFFISGSLPFVMEQPEYLSQYWPRVHSQTHSWLDWRWTADEIDRFICAFDDPYSGAQALLNGKPVYLKKSCCDDNEAGFHPFQYGIVFRVTANWVCVAVKGATLILQEVLDQSTGENLVSKIKPGDRFYSNFSQLEQHFEKVVYTPSGLKS